MNWRLAVERAVIAEVSTLEYELRYPNQQAIEPFPDTWVRATILPGDPEERAIGAGGFARVDGLLVLDCFDRIGNGSLGVLEMAGAISDMFSRGSQLEDTETGLVVRFRTPAPQSAQNDGSYYMLPVHCPWFTYVHHEG